MFLFDVNMAPLILNTTGSFVVGFVLILSGIPSQYQQTYFMYSGVVRGFCSVWTSFGNFVEESYLVLFLTYGPVKCLLNIVVTLIFAFAACAAGRKVAIVFKSGANLAGRIPQIHDEDARLAYETERASSSSPPSPSSAAAAAERSSASSVVYYSANRGGRERVLVSSFAQLLDSWIDKAKRHNTAVLTRRHAAIIGGLIVVPLVATIVVTTIPEEPTTSSVSQERTTVAFDYGITLMWSVVGAFAGTLLGMGRSPRRDVKW
jgi:fluoride ion exporter CrcB/FEX